MESSKRPPKPMHTYYIGAIKSKTDSKAVISDNREVLKQLGVKNIKQISTPEEFAIYWEREKCSGVVEIYGPVPEWMEEALKEAVWFKRVRVPYLISGETTRDIRPTGIRRKRYFKAKKEVILENEVKYGFKLSANNSIKK